MECFTAALKKVFVFGDTNKGSGEFIKGDEVFARSSRLPSAYQELQYIEGSGFQKIDSKLLINAGDVIDISGKYHFLEENNNTYTGALTYVQISAPST